MYIIASAFIGFSYMNEVCLDACYRIHKISSGVFLIFYRLNPSGQAMALGMTQSLTEMSTKDLPW
jgi:hypothetical protein